MNENHMESIFCTVAWEWGAGKAGEQYCCRRKGIFREELVDKM
jgi:hypothetical protein